MDKICCDISSDGDLDMSVYFKGFRLDVESSSPLYAINANTGKPYLKYVAYFRLAIAYKHNRLTLLLGD